MEVLGSGSGSSTRSGHRRRIHDDRMCNHRTPDADHHPENPNRTKVIWNKLQSSGITQRCLILDAKEAEDKHILSVHTKNHVNLIRNVSSKQFDSRRNRTASKFNSIYLYEGSSEAAYRAAGSVIEDKPCDICGDVGFAESMSTCFRCQIAREHIYCMKVLLQDIPEIWFCESCRSSNGIISPKPVAKELLPVSL